MTWLSDDLAVGDLRQVRGAHPPAVRRDVLRPPVNSCGWRRGNVETGDIRILPANNRNPSGSARGGPRNRRNGKGPPLGHFAHVKIARSR